MAASMKLAYLFFACMIVSGPITTNAAIFCSTVTNNVMPCLGYITRGGHVPGPCCNGVISLNRMANTTPDRQQARNLGPNLNTGLASGLPRACGVGITYAISTSTNCNNVK